MLPVDLIRDELQQFLSEVSDSSLLAAAVDGQARAQLHELTQKEIARWKASRKCIVSNCEDVAIRWSHTIQKAGPLTYIAENDYLLTPRFEAATSRVRLVRITPAKASTFPGFCPRHERLFHKFETRQRLQRNIDFVLQAYRATCREVVRLRIESTYFKEHRDLYLNAVDRFLFSELAGRIRTRGIDITPEAISVAFNRLDEPPNVDPFDALIDASLDDLQSLTRSQLEMLEHGMFTSATFEFPVGTLTLPEQLPVCLSGLDCFNLQSGTAHRRVLLILNVIPERDLTHIVISTSLENREFIGAYLDRIQGLLAAMNTVEAAMLHSTDHWFLRPSVWNTVPGRRQKALLTELMLRDTNSLDWPSASIFDEVRTRLLDKIEAMKPEVDRTENEQKVIDSERRKLWR